MAAFGRKLTFDSPDFKRSECLLLGKADIQSGASKSGSENVRYTPKSYRSLRLG
jgi:hypothetical protein